MGEKALAVKDLYCHQEPLPEDIVPLDDQFPNRVKQWQQNGDSLASATYEDLTLQYIHPPTTPNQSHTSRSSPSSPQSSQSPENLQFTPNPIDKGGRPGKLPLIQPKCTYRDVVMVPGQPSPNDPTSSSPIISHQTRFRSAKPIEPLKTSAITTSQPAIQIGQEPGTPSDTAAALHLEDFQLQHNNFDHWRNDKYQLLG
ncbi:hypothetical protein FRC06_003747 [Ceratobasidium sp. 370]|nr:hypothetical protein FRC06_003747 [Ceratobasidium sp. 370]